MGLLDRITAAGRYQAAIDAASTNVTAGLFDDPSSAPIASPWSSPGDLARVIAEDVFGVDDPPIQSRTAAMRIPAVARGRNLICTAIARLPVEVHDRAGRLAEQPTWTYRTDDGTTPQHKINWTVDDLIFHGWSLWTKVNDARGFPLTTSRVNYDRWRLDEDTNRILIDEQPADPGTLILIPGLHEGILNFGRDTLRDARNLYDIVRERLDTPIPNLDLHQTGGQPLTKEQRDDLIDVWTAARRKRRGGVGFTSEHIEAREMGKGDAELMIEARNAASLDLARLIGVSAGLIDATVPKASLNYETTSGRNWEFIDRDAYLYILPIVARLSLDDVCPRGQRAVFNVDEFTTPTPSPTGPVLED